MILNLFYKEWIKTRWIILLALIVGLCTVFYIFVSVHHRMIMLGAKSYILKMLYDDPPIIYYSLLKYIPVLAAIAIGLAQYMPEMSKKRYRLLLHLPIKREFAIFSMALYGMVALTLYNLIIMGYFVWTNTKIFPAEVTLPVLGSIIPWFLGSYLSIILLL
ncbi:MAG: hypothetical protein LIO65_05295 [Odoribacter sp.]|nr:hypothetical protein [Odoribacter sp.]